MKYTCNKKTNIFSLIELVARNHPDRIALICQDGQITYKQLVISSYHYMNYALSKKVSKNDLVGICEINCKEWYFVFFGLLALGAIPIGLNYRFRFSDICQISDELNFKGVFANEKIVAEEMTTSTQGRSQIWNIRNPEPITFSGVQINPPIFQQSTESDAPVLAVLTGGTTGRPKAVIWNHDAFIHGLYRGISDISPDILGNANWTDMVSSKNFKWPEGIKILIPQSLGHGTGLHWSISSLITGNTVILAETKSFDSELIWNLIKAHHIQTMTIIGDAMALPLIETLEKRGDCDFPSLKSIRSSGAKISNTNIKSLLKWLPQIKVIVDMGATEIGNIGSHVYSSPWREEKSGELNITPAPFLCLVDDQLNPIDKKSKMIGRIARHSVIANGYLLKEADEIFFSKDGVSWALGNDLGHYENDGSISIIGRSSRFINSGGEKVSADLVEEKLSHLPSVADCLVLPKHDDKWGEKVVAIVRLKSPDEQLFLSELDLQLRHQLPSFMIPKEFFFVSEIQRLFNGKTDYQWANKIINETPNLNFNSAKIKVSA